MPLNVPGMADSAERNHFPRSVTALLEDRLGPVTTESVSCIDVGIVSH